ncbi:MAG TPA: hypothetical protein VGQ74_12890 [Methylomirabilota bacterium]|jgi:hypothetical protein|nr:hypothetical protein [Methylomirabilota bacterium]
MARLVVLESMWNPKGKLLNEEPSVLPYLKAIRQSLAWEGIRINLVYRRFYSNYDLGLLLQETRRHRKPQVCYISSHGERRKLMGLGDKVIRLENLIEYCRPSPTTGYIFGACDFVTPDTAKKFLEATSARFVAGYQKEIPWTESMLVDSLFLSYLLGGTMKWVRTKHGERVPPLRQTATFEITHTENPQRVAGILYRDFPLAHDITFSVFILDRQRGRKPRLVSSFDTYRKSVDRARRLVRHL